MKTRITESELDLARGSAWDIEGVLDDADVRERCGITRVEVSENGVGGFDLIVTHRRALPRHAGGRM